MGITLAELQELRDNLSRSRDDFARDLRDIDDELDRLESQTPQKARDAATLETANRRLSTANPKPPAKPAGLPTEAEEMEALCLYLRSRPDLAGTWAHIPNERINKVERMKLSAQGVAPGMPDLLIFTRPLDGTVGVAIELKRSDRRSAKDPEHGASEAQRVWLMTLRVCGWHARVCYGAADAIQFIEAIYGARKCTGR